VLDRVSKRYYVYRRRAGGLKDRVLGALRGRPEQREELWALADVSMEVGRGETLGVIGPNGCGKSTLLQVVAGILEPESGAARVSGRVTSLLELGAGFSPDLSGRENIFLNASLHGLTQAQVRPKFDAIVAFAELERFIDMPVRNYSSGMYMRLGMAVAVHLDPEIVLIDEAFAVGDEAFQRKCLRKLKEFQQAGITILLVSHDLLLVERLASRACLLQAGRLHTVAPAADAIAEYHRLAAEHGGVAGEYRWGSRQIVITAVETRDQEGRGVAAFRTGQAMTVVLRFEAAESVDTPVFGLAIYREDGAHITGPNTRMSRYPIRSVEGRGEVHYRIERLPLLPGRYVLSVSAYDQDLSLAYDHRERVSSFTVIEGGTLERFGLVTFDGTWTLRTDESRPGTETTPPRPGPAVATRVGSS
jgi:ABC-type polysaccharide/polyol phosphate transport system ATPase subunit